MSNSIDSVDLTRSLPPALKHDPKMIALAQSIAQQLQFNDRIIEKNIIYARMDKLDEKTLDILAYDLHVDWYDYTYPIEVKRQTIRDSVKVHRKLGTKYAVETALRAVFPGAKVEEWFDYGGKPYYFRIAADVPETGVSAVQQRRILERVQFYKNLRSHLDSIEFQTESIGFVRTGAFVTAGEMIEIFPELTTTLEMHGKTGTDVFASQQQSIAVYPELSKCLEIQTKAAAGGSSSARQAVEIFPELTKEITMKTQAETDVFTAAQQTVEIFPELTASVELTAEAAVSGAAAARQMVEIFPEQLRE